MLQGLWGIAFRSEEESVDTRIRKKKRLFHTNHDKAVGMIDISIPDAKYNRAS